MNTISLPVRTTPVDQLSGALMGAPLDVQFPKKLTALMDRAKRYRYYVAYGGRGGGRSWAFARALLLQCLDDPLFVLCAREVQNSINESVKRLLETQIEMLGLADFFTIRDTEITCVSGARIVFAGLRNMSAKNLKSYEGVDIVWVEEAEGVSKRSWNNLIPTVRADGSEIWVTFNPDMDTDETYQRFVVQRPENAWVQKITYADNEWFPEVLEQERQQLGRQDPDEYLNIWEGEPRAVVAGAIYTRELTRMMEDHRIRPVPYDPRLLVHTIWDLGWNDATAIIFAQRLHSEVRVIDYEEQSFLRPDEWAKIIGDKPYVYGSHWLPHDGDSEMLQGAGVSLKKQLKPLLRMEPKIIKRAESVEDPIRAARMMFPRAYVDEERCDRLLKCLRHFKRAVPQTTGEPGTPVKNEYRHGADAWGGLAVIVDQLSNDVERKPVKLADDRPKDPAMGM